MTHTLPTPAQEQPVEETQARFPRVRDHLAPRPWVSTSIAVIVFCIPGLFCTLATVIEHDWLVAGGCAAWGLVGFSMIWFFWAQRRKYSHAAFCAALDQRSIVDILKGLEEDDLDVDEAVDIMEYLREQRTGWSEILAQTQTEAAKTGD